MNFVTNYDWLFVFFVTTTTSRAVTVSTRGCTYRLPGSLRQFPLRGSIYADPADIQMLRLVLGSPAGGLGIHGSDGRSVPLVGPNCLRPTRDSDKSEQTTSVSSLWAVDTFYGSNIVGRCLPYTLDGDRHPCLHRSAMQCIGALRD